MAPKQMVSRLVQYTEISLENNLYVKIYSQYRQPVILIYLREKVKKWGIALTQEQCEALKQISNNIDLLSIS